MCNRHIHLELMCSMPLTSSRSADGAQMRQGHTGTVRTRRPPARGLSWWERGLLLAVGVILFVLGTTVHRDRATLAAALVAVAGLLVVLSLLAPYVEGIKGSLAGVSFDIPLYLPRAAPLEIPQELRSGGAPISGAGDFAAITLGPDIDYIVIRLGSGDQWLASRLFAFAVVLRQMRGLRCIVFTHSGWGFAGDKLLGLASPDDVRSALGWRFPWFERTLFGCWEERLLLDQQQAPAGVRRPEFVDRPIQLTPQDAELLFVRYVNALRNQDASDTLKQTQLAPDDPDWVTLRSDNQEHTRWLNGPLVEQLLGDGLKDARVQASGSPTRLVSDALEQEGDFVAVVSRTDAFRDLIDRRALLQNRAAMETE